MSALLHTLIIVLAGGVAGVMGALLGLGGGIFLVPFLNIVLGLTFRQAVAISLMTVIATSSAVSAGTAGRHLMNLRLGMLLPGIVINTSASLRSADVNLERAAVIHGAHPLWAVLRITLPIISPGIVIGAIFAFVHSAHELLVATFVLGGVVFELDPG